MSTSLHFPSPCVVHVIVEVQSWSRRSVQPGSTTSGVVGKLFKAQPLLKSVPYGTPGKSLAVGIKAGKRSSVLWVSAASLTISEGGV